MADPEFDDGGVRRSAGLLDGSAREKSV